MQGLSAYAGYGGFLSGDPEATEAHYLKGGFTYLLNFSLQLDLNGGVRLDDESDETFLGFGLAQRF